MTKNDKILTLVEGRTVNYRTINDMKQQTADAGWGFKLLGQIPHDEVSCCAFKKYFSDYVLWRDLGDDNNAVEIARIIKWLDLNENILTVNTHLVGGRGFSSDKFYQHGLFGMDPELRVHTPVVFLAKNKKDIMDLVRGGKLKFPIVIKERFGTAGKGIVLIETEKDLTNEVFDKMGAVMVEPYIEADYDWRVFVVGGVAVGAMRKTIDESDPGNFVAKSAGKNKVKEEDPEILKKISRIACKMAAVSGLEYAGCDIIREKKSGRFFVLETNNSAGWQNHFNEVTGMNMGMTLLDWFEDMSVLKEKGFYKGVLQYMKNRMKYLDSETRKLFESILDWRADIKNVKGNDLNSALQRAYRSVSNGEDANKYKWLLEEVERRPLCWAGAFIGGNIWGKDGILEDSIMPTACYLAIREKYDKIVGVNKGKL